MNQALKYGFFFTLALPLGGAFGSDKLQDDMSKTLESLNAITSKVDEAPALLLLTPSQLDAATPPPPPREKRSTAKPSKNALSKRESESQSAPVAELKALQAKINQLNATVSQQDQALKQLRQTAQQDVDARAEVARLKQNLQENLQATEQMQRDLAAATAAKSENQQGASRLQQALDKSQQQSSSLQKQLDALALSQNDKNKENQALQTQLNESRKQNEEIQKTLAVLTAKASEKEQKASALQKQVEAMTAAQAGKSSEQDALKAQLVQGKKQAEVAQQQLALLTGKAAESEQQVAALKKQLETLAASESEKAKGSQALQVALDESRKQGEELQNQLTALRDKASEKMQENSALEQQLSVLQKMQKDAVVEPKTESEIRDYAIGSSLADDMLALLKERAAQGVKIDNRLALAGVQDTFAGNVKLPQAQIDKALRATEAALSANEKQRMQETEAAGARYIAQFKKQKQVKKDSSGYFYRIDNAGKGKIDDASIVSVVVKESLTNGKVIKDMAAAGTSITQPLGSYPPMFRSALSQLQNHGSMTMVVPPALAYGDKGLPPDIPPGSTMVYNVSILDVVAPADVVAPVR
ncbi:MULTISPECIES: FKBP-type peptidyl-prolyl cis-trans isomerase N-terminal domain-containing protein [unclassified Serratia (in: enterobacteria)]|uniref:FKBP-type peptidyl-prolyl cis-trans isomerase N-terminal domain-containing protein n=1 Tax=unclassified Serratia (in: enterobacteria) TaxID=2647522 RepID=UPI00307673E6